MKYTEPIEYPGIDYIRDNSAFYKEKFIQDTILVFRNANLSFEEHEELQRVLGDTFGWYPNTSTGSASRYIEDHQQSELRTETNKDEVIIPWHIEHPSYENPIVAGLWNMITFNIDSTRGTTLFMDTTKVFELLSEEDKDFLNKCTVNSYEFVNDVMRPTKAIKPHWLTNEPTIRFSLDRVQEDWHNLYEFDGRKPTPDESREFIAIANRKVISEVWTNEELRLVHEWQQGDIIIPDLYKLAHAVMGGFNPEDRKFTGLWSHQSPI
jgi:alpha-ketoglutarate-dependent taurine dioxygenase